MSRSSYSDRVKALKRGLVPSSRTAEYLNNAEYHAQVTRLAQWLAVTPIEEVIAILNAHLAEGFPLPDPEKEH